MLFGNVKDLDLLKEYSEYIKGESDYTKDNTGIIYSGIGGLLVMFAFPIWGYSVGEIIKEAVSSGNIIETYKLLAAYLTIISACIAFIFFLKKSADSYYNSLSYKYLSILRFNEQLRINLKRKYMIENNAC